MGRDKPLVAGATSSDAPAGRQARSIRSRVVAVNLLAMPIAAISALFGSPSVAWAEPNTAVAAESVVVLGPSDYGRDVSQLFEAVLRARRDGVRVRFVAVGPHEPVDVKAWLASGEVALVFRLETMPNGDWKLWLHNADRALARDLEGGVDTNAAAVEAAALMAAHAALALLADVPESQSAELQQWQETGKLDSSPEAGPPSGVDSTGAKPSVGDSTPSAVGGLSAAPHPGGDIAEESPEKASSGLLHGRAFVSAGYRGSNYSSSAAWSSGGQVGLGWQTIGGPSFRLGYTFVPAFRRDSALGSFEVWRQPAELSLGWRIPIDGVSLSPLLSIIWERIQRSQAQPEPGVSASGDRTLTVWGMAATMEAEVKVGGRVGLHMAVGPEFYVDGVEFRSNQEGSQPLLSSHQVRARVEAGAKVSFF